MWGLRSSRTVAISLAAAVSAVVCLLPVTYVLGSAIGEGARIVAGIASDPRQRALLSTTLCVGIGSAVLATTVGSPLGFVLARVDLPMKSLLRTALAAPAVLPPYVVALAWVELPGGPWPWTYSTAGVVIVTATVFFPVPMLVTEIALRRLDGHLEDAAILAASQRRTLARITLPLVAPPILSGSLIVMVLAMSEFSVPGLLRVRVFTSEVFTAFAALYDFRRATALALPLLAIGITSTALAMAVLTRHQIATRRSAARSSTLTFERWRHLSLVAALVVTVATLLTPVVVLAIGASQSTTLADVLSGSVSAIVKTLALAAAGATAVTLLAVVAGDVRSGLSTNAGIVMDAIWMALFCVPSTVLGVGLIATWNRASVFSVYGTPYMIVLGYVARLLPIAALIVGAVMRTIPRSRQEAAATAGATWGRTIGAVVLPELKGALVATWVFVFVLAAGEVGTTILVSPPGESTLPIRVYTLVANAPPGRLAALALVQAAVVLLPLVALVAIAARSEDAWLRRP